MDIRRIKEEDLNEVLTLCLGNKEYYDYLHEQPTIENLKADLSAVPPGKTVDDKYFMGFYEENHLVAILDFILRYPSDDTAYIGWLIVDQQQQGKGIASQIVEMICARSQQAGFQKIELGCIKGYAHAQNFWKKHGFLPNGRSKQMKDITMLVLSKTLES